MDEKTKRFYSMGSNVGDINFNNPLYVNDKRFLVIGSNPGFEDVWRFIGEYFKSSMALILLIKAIMQHSISEGGNKCDIVSSVTY